MRTYDSSDVYKAFENVFEFMDIPRGALWIKSIAGIYSWPETMDTITAKKMSHSIYQKIEEVKDNMRLTPEDMNELSRIFELELRNLEDRVTGEDVDGVAKIDWDKPRDNIYISDKKKKVY